MKCRKLFLSLLAAVLVTAVLSPAYAAKKSTKAATKAAETTKAVTAPGWHKAKKGYEYYFLNEAGKLQRVKATKTEKYHVQEIGKNKYCFNTSGYQVHGWRKIGKSYYFFAFGNGGKGYMLVNTKMNNIKLSATGEAVLNNDRNKKRVPLMANYSEWADQITRKNPLAPKKDKLKVCYDYLRRKMRYVAIDYKGKFGKGSGYWIKEHRDYFDIWGANWVYTRHTYDCHPIAAAFAYLANAIGYTENVKIYAMQWYKGGGWHGFNSINGRYYDVSLGRKSPKRYYLYAMKRAYHKKQIKVTKDINSDK